MHEIKAIDAKEFILELKELVKQALILNGFDGLFNDECGCSINDLAPCGELYKSCESAYELNERFYPSNQYESKEAFHKKWNDDLEEFSRNAAV